jgi:hypothetical protein
MRFRIRKQAVSTPTLMRKLGYKPIGRTPKDELNCVRPLGGDYPRFHIYVTEEESTLLCSIHLDQKKPSYAGTTAHGGDYNSDIVKQEALRIRDMLSLL